MVCLGFIENMPSFQTSFSIFPQMVSLKWNMIKKKKHEHHFFLFFFTQGEKKPMVILFTTTDGSWKALTIPLRPKLIKGFKCWMPKDTLACCFGLFGHFNVVGTIVQTQFSHVNNIVEIQPVQRCCCPDVPRYRLGGGYHGDKLGTVGNLFLHFRAGSDVGPHLHQSHLGLNTHTRTYEWIPCNNKQT